MKALGGLAGVVGSLSRVSESLAKAALVFVASVILSAILIYSYRVAPGLLWAVIFVGALGVGPSVLCIVLGWVGNSFWDYVKMVIAVVLIWATVFIYIDFMRYLSAVWQIEMHDPVRKLLLFPRYFAFHAVQFFRDFWSVITGAPYVAPVQFALPEPHQEISKNASPLLIVSSGLKDVGGSFLLGLFTNFVFQLWLDRRKGTR